MHPSTGRSLSVLLVVIMVSVLSSCSLVDRLGTPNESATPDPAPAPLAAPLTFHQVDQVSAAPCGSSGTGDRTFPDPSKPETCLALAEPAISVDQLADVTSAVTEGGADWTVTITLRDQDRAAMTALTEELAQQPEPRNRMALVLDGEVLVAPTVASAIPGGALSITGNFTQQEAEDLAHRLGG
ncbi:SecDF P1 head subdomain-containing protein [Propionibacteriaceae bacterium Y1685]|uniref:SecDF P1 head subdomain-containing protein n=1 Tax=Microlunatus sp. Y1700 TaxID=3418487 RepID=UPI003B78C45F